MFLVQLDNKLAQVPHRASPGSIGYDVRACESGEIPPRQRQCISTGLKFQIPTTHYIRIGPRSGLAFRHGIDVLGGIVDSDYRGEVKVILMNNSDNVWAYHCGDRIAQLIFERADCPDLQVVDQLMDTSRGTGGLGSTGTR
uniref:dUTP diphosphatase n=1 Tax=viral metagenome TaxID=1070528 RepID=A0A6C0BN69_9ZZZZ